MCRLLAYAGDPIYLEELVCKPQHSLVRQSLQAEEAVVVTNGDGFGLGWYADRHERGERSEPGIYRKVTPAWSDENLLNLCSMVRSHLFFAPRARCHRYGRSTAKLPSVSLWKISLHAQRPNRRLPVGQARAGSLAA